MIVLDMITSESHDGRVITETFTQLSSKILSVWILKPTPISGISPTSLF